MTDLVKKESAELAKFDASAMFADMELPQGRHKIPFIKLLQSNSNEVAEEGEKIGTYYNSLTKENYGEGFKFVPVKLYFGAAYLELKKGLICKSLDGVTSINGDRCSECPHGVYYKNWIAKHKPNKCIDTIDVIGIVVDTLEPAIMSFKSKSYPGGYDLATNIRKRIKKGDKGIYEFLVYSYMDSNDSGRFYISKTKSPLLVENSDVLQAVYKAHKLVKEQEIDIVEEGVANGGTRQAD